MSSTSYQSNISFNLTATIGSGNTASAVIDLSGTSLVGMISPSALTGATLTFSASPTEDGTYNTLYRNGSDVSLTFAADKYILLEPSDFVGVRFLKVTSDSTEAADREFTLITRPV